MALGAVAADAGPVLSIARRDGLVCFTSAERTLRSFAGALRIAFWAWLETGAGGGEVGFEPALWEVPPLLDFPPPPFGRHSL